MQCVCTHAWLCFEEQSLSCVRKINATDWKMYSTTGSRQELKSALVGNQTCVVGTQSAVWWSEIRPVWSIGGRKSGEGGQESHLCGLESSVCGRNHISCLISGDTAVSRLR
jgi:hypothetical protein